MKLKHDSLVNYQIMVTGASGFLGRRLIRQLITLGAYVVGIDIAPFALESEKLQEYKGTLVHKVGDVSSIDFLNQSLKELRTGKRGYSAFFHLSGLTHVKQCQANPYTAFQKNVMHTARVLEACRKWDLRRIIFPSTALIYGEDSAAIVTEECPPRPESIYASTKLAAEVMIQGYAESYSFSCDIARLSNVYGAGGNTETAVGTAIRQARLGGPVELRTLRPVRDFIYCEDVAEGFIRLLTSGNEPGCRVFNLSTGKGNSIGQIAKMVCEIAGIKSEIIVSKGDDASRNSRLVLKNERLINRTAWQPAFSISKGLKNAWEEMGG